MKLNYERIKYSPFGKRITNVFKGDIILSVCTVPLGLLFCSFGLMAGSVDFCIVTALLFLVVPAFLVASSVRKVLLEARLLSEMSDEEHNKLVLEYKQYEERNIIRYGHLTTYGMVLDAHILPWRNIKAIEFAPGEYRYVYRKGGGYMKYFPAKITVTSKFGEKTVKVAASIGSEDYDLSDEIARFLESIPKYTDHRFAIDNRYYFAK